MTRRIGFRAYVWRFTDDTSIEYKGLHSVLVIQEKSLGEMADQPRPFATDIQYCKLTIL